MDARCDRSPVMRKTFILVGGVSFSVRTIHYKHKNGTDGYLADHSCTTLVENVEANVVKAASIRLYY